METNERTEILNKAAEAIKAATYRAADRKLIRVWKDRVYLDKKGSYLVINSDGSLDTSSVGGISNSQFIASTLRDAGLNVPERTVLGFGGKVAI